MTTFSRLYLYNTEAHSLGHYGLMNSLAQQRKSFSKPEIFYRVLFHCLMYGRKDWFDQLSTANDSLVASSPSLVRLERFSKEFFHALPPKLVGGDSELYRTHLLSSENHYCYDKGANGLFVIFSNAYNNMMVAHPIIYALCKETGFDVLFVTYPGHGDLRNRGVPGIGRNGVEVFRRLSDWISSRGYHRVRIIGCSSSAHYSLIFSEAVKAEYSIQMGFRYHDKDEMPAKASHDADYMAAELRVLEGKLNQPACFLYGSRAPRDIEDLQRIKKGVHISTFLAQGYDHICAQHFIAEGILQDLLAARPG